MTAYEKFKSLDVDMSIIGLEKGDEEGGYFCTPKGARVIGWECDGIHYCFIDGFGEMVFAVNPESADDRFVKPLAENFESFISLILACEGTTAAEQINIFDRAGFDEFMKNSTEFIDERRKVLKILENELGIKPMKDPFGYVKNLLENFDYSKIKFTPEYYDVLGLEIPDEV